MQGRMDATHLPEEVRRFFRAGYIEYRSGAPINVDYNAWTPPEREAYMKGRAAASENRVR